MIKAEYRIELHCHTEEPNPCSRVSAKTLAELYAEEGYDGITFTDHFFVGQEAPDSTDWQERIDRFLIGYWLTKEAGEPLGLTVFLGMEIRFPGSANDYLVIGLNEELLRAHPEIEQMDFPAFYQFAKEQELLVIQAHPFREICTPADPQYLHGVEVYNGQKGHNSSRNHLAEEMAEKHHLIQTAG